MNGLLALTGRNLRIFFRDRMAVFFSLLAALILVGLYALFLGQLQTSALREQFPGESSDAIDSVVYGWVFAGIVMITTVTTPLSAVSAFVDDRSSGRFSDFLVSPVRRPVLVLGYLLSSFIVGVVITVTVLAIGQVFMLAQGLAVMTPGQLVEVLGWVLLSTAAFAAMGCFAVSFVDSSGAFSALSTIVGTVIGFLAGAYIPPGTLPEAAVRIISALPFAQAAMLMRRPSTANALDALTGGQELAAAPLRDFYGIDLAVGDLQVTTGVAAGALTAVLVVFTALAAWRMSRTIR